MRVRAVLEAGNHPTRIVPHPMMGPSRFSWRFDTERSASQLVMDDGLPLRDDQIAGVFVRSTGWIDPSGWGADDLAYVQAETQAALLAWLWSLACPVVNRYPSAIWYRPQAPLLSWGALLRRCGLPTLETVITNVEGEARAFGRRISPTGAVESAVYGPLTGDVRYLVSAEKDWDGLAALQRTAPVCLTYPHGAARFACLVGEQVVWAGQPIPGTARLAPALRRFAAAAGLAFLEVAFAATSAGPCVIAVEPRPYFEHFDEAARQGIAEGIAHLLTTEVHPGRGEPAEPLPARFS